MRLKVLELGGSDLPLPLIAQLVEDRFTFAAAGAVAQQLPLRWRVAFPGVPEQGGHQGRRDWLPADGLALLAQEDQALLGIEILRAQRQRTAPAAGSLGVQAQQQRVQLRVIARGRRRVVDLGQALAGDRPAGRGQAALLVHLPGRVVRRPD